MSSISVGDVLKATSQDKGANDIRSKEEVDDEIIKPVEERVNEIQRKDEPLDGSGDPCRPSGSVAAEVSGAQPEAAVAAEREPAEAAGGGARPPMRAPVSAARALITVGVHGLLTLLFADILVGRPLQNTVGLTARYWAVGSIVACVMLLTAASFVYMWRPWGAARRAEAPAPAPEDRQSQRQMLPPYLQLPPGALQLPQSSGPLRTRSAPELKVLFFRDAHQPTSSGDSLGPAT